MKLLKQVNLGKFGVRPANFSGITRINGNRYAVVDDKELIDGFMYLDIDMKLCQLRRNVFWADFG